MKQSNSKRLPRRFLTNTLIVVAGIATIGWIWQDRYLSDGSSNSDSVESAANPVESTSTTISLQSRSYREGDCIAWNQDEGRYSVRITRVVPCADPHLMEYTGKTKHPALLREAMPDSDAWEIFIENVCTKPAEQHIGYSLVPDGRFFVSALIPTEESWKDGDRAVQCGIDHRELAAGSEKSLQFTGAVKGQSQVLLPTVGKCFKFGEAGGEVECPETHGAEITGAIDIRSNTFPGSPEQWEIAFRSECTKKAREYLGKPIPPGFEANWIEMSKTGWDAGQRTTSCTLVKFVNDNLVETTGSLR